MLWWIDNENIYYCIGLWGTELYALGRTHNWSMKDNVIPILIPEDTRVL